MKVDDVRDFLMWGWRDGMTGGGKVTVHTLIIGKKKFARNKHLCIVDVILERNGVLGCQKLSAQRKYEMLIIAESYSC